MSFKWCLVYIVVLVAGALAWGSSVDRSREQRMAAYEARCTKICEPYDGKLWIAREVCVCNDLTEIPLPPSPRASLCRHS